jgi:hypothetical protein
MFLRWDGRESFCDEGVQDVMLRLHPDRWKAPNTLPGFQIHLWSVADSISILPSELQWENLFPYMEQFPQWTVELLAALMRHRTTTEKRLSSPATALDQLLAWRGERYLYETPRQQHTHEAVVKHNTLLKKPLRDAPAKLRKWMQSHTAAPLMILEKLPPPKKWLEGKARSISPEAYRQAAIKENRRRDSIMRHWAGPWLAHLRGSGVTKTAPEK